MSAVEIQLLEPHQGQKNIIAQSKRFNVTKCGRRWGKTTFCDELILEKALQINPYDIRRSGLPPRGYPVGYYAPTYKDMGDFWADFKALVAPIIKEKDETDKHIILLNGSKIDFWSLDNPDSSRGRKYGRIIIDECEKIKKIKYAWEKAVRATLTDYMGDAWFFSTPNRLGNPDSYFLDNLCKNHEKFDNWSLYEAPSHENPYLPVADLEEAEERLDPLTYKQEYLAQDVRQVTRPFLYGYSKDKHLDASIKFNSFEPIDLCFDFNVDPATVLIRQHGPDWCYTLDEIRVRNTDPYEICEEINTRYGNALFVVYGDATGRNRNFAVKGNKTVYQILMAELGLSQKHFRVPKANPSVRESRTLSNSLLTRFPNYKIHPRCKYYIEDLMYVAVDEKGEIDKKTHAHRSHLLDGGRYHDWECFRWWLKGK